MPLFLGLDSSTQSMKALIVDSDDGSIVASGKVDFGRELPGFGCPNGVLENEDPLVKASDPLLWAAALDALLEKLSASGAPLSEVAGIGGSAQQHGSVYLNARFAPTLARLDARRGLAEQLGPALSRKIAPIWMDSSTGEECAKLEELFGERLRAETGSPAIERFTGPQIMRFARREPEAYALTASIHLVGSFLCSLLLGAEAPCDYGDGSGMNLLNLKTLAWDREIAEAVAPGLLAKLPRLAAPGRPAGGLAPYFEKYGLKAGAPVAPFTGDNPATLIGCGAWRPGMAVTSFGTSDTFFAALASMRVDPEGCGHVFGNPAGGFMSLLCFKNGSLARERLRDSLQLDWAEFDELALAAKPGGDGKMLLPLFVPEITPRLLEAGLRFKGDDAFERGEAAPGTLLRAMLETQALSLRKHSAWIGRGFPSIRVAGGASKSRALLRIYADVLQTRLERVQSSDAAALGAALIAANATGGLDWETLSTRFCASGESVEPDKSLAGLYASMARSFDEFEKEIIDEGKGL